MQTIMGIMDIDKNKKGSSVVLRKILIISYFFPPCNVTGSFRIESWAKYLHEYGYYPIIVTRHWNNELTNWQKFSESDLSPTSHEVHSNYEVYYTTYKPSLRDKIFAKHGTSRFSLFRKFLSAIEVLFQNYCNRVIPYRELYSQSKRVIEKEDDLKYLICSGSPFVLFKFAHKLSKRYNIPWVADYRDDWSTSQWYQIPDQRDLYTQSKLIRSLEERSEKKWLKSATCFTTISPFYVDRISRFIGKPGHVVMNGYDDEGLPLKRQEDTTTTKEFTIVFNGTLYYTQPIEAFLEILKEVITKFRKETKVMMLFPGLANDPNQVDRVRESLQGFEEHYTITKRMSRAKVLDIQLKANLTLMLSHNDIKGVTSSKLFDYIGLEKTILLYPGDNDILESIINELGNGKVCKTESDALDFLDTSLRNHIGGSHTNPGIPKEIRNKFTRKSQAKKLAEILDLHCTSTKRES